MVDFSTLEYNPALISTTFTQPDDTTEHISSLENGVVPAFEERVVCSPSLNAVQSYHTEMLPVPSSNDKPTLTHSTLTIEEMHSVSETASHVVRYASNTSKNAKRKRIDEEQDITDVGTYLLRKGTASLVSDSLTMLAENIPPR